MEIGSIVECVKLSRWENAPKFGFFVICPKIKNQYTVRGFFDNMEHGSISVYLEEIKNKSIQYPEFPTIIFPEPSFEMKCFRELLPPMDIEEMINENIAEPELA